MGSSALVTEGGVPPDNGWLFFHASGVNNQAGGNDG
jgi:hypothetical protein